MSIRSTHELLLFLCVIVFMLCCIAKEKVNLELKILMQETAILLIPIGSLHFTLLYSEFNGKTHYCFTMMMNETTQYVFHFSCVLI